MPNLQSGLSGAATGAAIGSAIPGVGTLIGAGVGGLIGLFAGPKKDKRMDRMMRARYEQLQDPDYMRDDFQRMARELAPSQSDILGRLRAGGLGLGQSSVLANRQFQNEQARAREAANSAFTRFRLGNQGSIDNALGAMVGQSNFNQQRRDSFNNELLSAGSGFLGMRYGGGSYADAYGGRE